MALWGGFRPYPGSRTAPKCDSFHDTVHRWQHYGAAWHTRYAASHTVCPVQGSAQISGRERLDFAALGSITFENPDMETFKGLPLAIEAAKRGGSMPTVFNAANEKAVALFLQRKIQFLDIYTIIEEAMENHQVISNPAVEDILKIEQDVYDRIESRW